MKKFYLETTEEEVRKYYYVVDAENLENAKEQVMHGEVDYVDSAFVTGEIISIQEGSKNDKIYLIYGR